jgi:hypothetical protein
MTPKILDLKACAAISALFCVLTIGSVSARADEDGGVLPTAAQKALSDGKQYAASQAAKKDLADETCTEYGDHDAALPETNPLDNGCMGATREIVNSSPAGVNPNFNPGLAQPVDPHNPYAAPQDEAKAYHDLVEKVKGPQGRFAEGDKEKQDEEKFGVYTRYLSRPDGAKLADTLTESNYWADFVILVTSEGGDELRIVTRRANQPPTPSDTGVKPPLKSESIIFEPNVQGALSFAGPEGFSLETPDENYKYVYFYHQLLRSWLKP